MKSAVLVLLFSAFASAGEAAYNNCVVVCSYPNGYGQNRCHVWGYDEYGVPKRINTQNWDTSPQQSLDSALEALRGYRANGKCESTGNPVVQNR